ncbi:winged helix-turn-helix domain-containing protein [Paenibacillus sp. J2TS4]|uniref:helix-turn-helix domain-containing protein n=1 Tax=Paenibacillus sp. J2TS4 TaxID=2807194 RepID=UPI001BD13AB3|nr:winged helix-turn-helix domain-containing protein [Paenibacillus sp. J2TS4]
MENKELKEVENRLIQEKSRRMFERYQTVYLHLLGYSNQQIASIIRRSDRTVRTYIQHYRESGLDGLQIQSPPGRSERLTEEQQTQLKKTIMESIPHEVGFSAKFNWTLELICEFIQREFEQSYSLRGASKLMHRLNMSYTKPTYTLAAADEEKQKEFVEKTFPGLKKLR